ncbi:RNase H family protein [Nocardia goodfellowii]
MVEAWTAGTSLGDPGVGGWGAVLRWGNRTRDIVGAESHSTVDRMELMAAVQSLECLNRPTRIRIHSGSSYLRAGCLREAGCGRQATSNIDLWQRLETAANSHRVTWDWAQSTFENPDAAHAFELARKAAIEDAAPSFCVHEMRINECAYCTPRRPGVLSHGWRTEGGTVYHNDRDCDWLRKGQRDALRKGLNLHDIVAIAWASVDSTKMQPCDYCCTPLWVRRHRS